VARSAPLLFRLLVPITAAVAGVLAGPHARAQLHWDASAQAGVMKRFLGSRAAGGSDAGFGPVGELHGHVAILPLVRVGAYVSHDISPQPGDTTALQITSAGARVKISSPLPLDPWRVWAFVGIGYAGVYGPSFRTPIDVAGARVDALGTGAGGGFFEVPFGVGASYKLRRPWHLTAELSGRGGFGFAGSVFDTQNGRAGFAEGQPQLLLSNPGTPSFALALMFGILLDL
jgi:hypothetical protein